MSPGVLTLRLTAALIADPEAAATPDPCADAPIRCKRGFVGVVLPGVLVPLGEVHHPDSNSSRPQMGTVTGLGGGVFHTWRRIGIAFGGRVSYGFTRLWYDDTFASDRHFLHVGPELRYGVVGRRVFGFATLRGGYSRWTPRAVYRTTYDFVDSGGHVGVGGGLWGLLGRHLLIGGEVVHDFVFDVHRADPLHYLQFTVALGVWLGSTAAHFGSGMSRQPAPPS